MKLVVAALALAVLASCAGGQKNATNDALIGAGVKAKLAGVDADSATAVDVSVTGGRVVLAGQARNDGERQAYVRAARSVSGVSSVEDRLTVNPHLRGVREQSNDALLAARVAAAIAGQAGVNVFKVKTTARDGVVTLTGTVPSSSIARTILDTARGVSGVKRVVDRVAIHR
jgi:hyperosmotically inducible protein